MHLKNKKRRRKIKFNVPGGDDEGSYIRHCKYVSFRDFFFSVYQYYLTDFSVEKTKKITEYGFSNRTNVPNEISEHPMHVSAILEKFPFLGNKEIVSTFSLQ